MKSLISLKYWTTLYPTHLKMCKFYIFIKYYKLVKWTFFRRQDSHLSSFLLPLNKVRRDWKTCLSIQIPCTLHTSWGCSNWWRNKKIYGWIPRSISRVLSGSLGARRRRKIIYEPCWSKKRDNSARIRKRIINLKNKHF